MSRDDDLWTHALRAGLDAVVLQFESQVRSHVAHASAAAAQREETLRRQLAEQGAALASLRAQLAEREAAVRSVDAALQREAAECARLRAALQRAESSAAESASRAQRAQEELDAKSRALGALGEQFAAEAAFTQAAAGAAGTILGDALAGALGAALDGSPGSYGALKSRRLDAVLAGAMRERGRTVARAPLSDAESRALAALAAAAGCELVTPEVGARYAPSAMEKVGERVEPAEEDHVVECAMPGLRLGGASGAAVQPRVIVGTA